MATIIDHSVLYVEDDKVVRNELGEFLFLKFREVRQADNGKSGLEVFSGYKADLVITDIRMPVMNGLEMAREIRKIAPSTRIIVTSAYQDTEFFLEAIDIGVSQFVLKPVNLEKLMLAVQKSFAPQ
jgi:YesN/AraC family two-component response regulator